MLGTYQRAIPDGSGRRCARSAIHLEAELCGRRRGDGQSVPHREIHNALRVVTLRHGDIGKPGGLIDGGTGTDLVNLYQEPGLVLRLLHTQVSNV